MYVMYQLENSSFARFLLSPLEQLNCLRVPHILLVCHYIPSINIRLVVVAGVIHSAQAAALMSLSNTCKGQSHMTLLLMNPHFAQKQTEGRQMNSEITIVVHLPPNDDEYDDDDRHENPFLDKKETRIFRHSTLVLSVCLVFFQPLPLLYPPSSNIPRLW